MGQLHIKNWEDLKELTGWTIKEAGRLPNTPGIGLKLSHAAAEKDILVTFIATVKMGRSGNVVVATESLEMKVADIESPE